MKKPLVLAQESLARARVRADAYLKKLDGSKLPQESALEVQVDKEYHLFQKEIFPIADQVNYKKLDVSKDSTLFHSPRQEDFDR